MKTNSLRLPVDDDQGIVREKQRKGSILPGGENELRGRSQIWRSCFQIGFLLLNLWIGIQFFLWVRFFETGGRTISVSRPPGVEGWLPIASLMNLKVWILTGSLPAVHPAGVVLLITFLTISFLLRKAFCSWLCPIGTLSETLGTAGHRLVGRNLRPPVWVDNLLRSLKYVLLGVFLLAVGSMSVSSIRLFLDGPYGVIADVKMLNFFRHLSITSAVVIALLFSLSLLIKNVWCRYLCPYGALLGLLAWASPMRVRRNSGSCVGCGKCTRVCPSRLPVDLLDRVRSPECTGCYQCVESCPVQGTLGMSVGRLRAAPAWMATGIATLFLGLVLGAVFTGHWKTQLPEHVYFELVPRAEQFSHPYRLFHSD